MSLEADRQAGRPALPGALELQPDERVPGKPFSDPENTPQDLGIVSFMLSRLKGLLSEVQFQSFVMQLDEEGRKHRIAVTNPDRLRTQDHLVLVGFFGQRRENSEVTEEINQVDEHLIADFTASGQLLSYSSLELPNGQWGNVPIFRDHPSMHDWRQNQRHAHAVRQLAARHYQSVRLHFMELPGGLMGEREITLNESRYFDFDEAQLWRAVRRI